MTPELEAMPMTDTIEVEKLISYKSFRGDCAGAFRHKVLGTRLNTERAELL